MVSKTIFKSGISNLSEIELARINELVSNSNGTAVCTSYDVAKVFGKEHNKVCGIIKKSIQRIGECMEQMSSSQKNARYSSQDLDIRFEECDIEYTNGCGGTQICKGFIMNRDGFNILVNGFSGERALLYKMAFVEAFNKMERVIKSAVQPSYHTPQTYIEALKETLRLAEENEKLTLENKEQALKIEEDAPKVECWDQFIASKSNVHIRTFVKMIQDRFPKVREAWIFKSLREAGILQSHGFFKNIPYAEYGPTGKGYFALKQSAFGATPLLTPKGQEWCYKMIKDYYEATGDIEDMFEEEF